MKKVIELKDVWKKYNEGQRNEVIAVKNLDAEIYQGEFVAFMGPSGSGKSTSMNLIGSLDTPSKGAIYLDNQDISKLSESDLAQLRGKKIGFIFQEFNLIKNLTAKENVTLPMTYQGYSEQEMDKRGKELLKTVELSDRENHYPSELSGGEQQRVAVSRSLANDPEVILADEPTGNLDSKTGEKVMGFLQKLNKEGKTIIIITHEEDIALRYAEKIYWIKDGEINKVTKNDKKKDKSN
ncbi:MAG: ABC transporter ATP-binding protein [Candidatus Pacearchaeota archaeon]